jgi:CHAT domain-containing protein
LGGLGLGLNSEATILEQLKQTEQHNLRTVLIFDQFEEFFFVYPDPAERRQFFRFVGECLNILAVKVILSLREDYLHYLLECDRLDSMKIIGSDILTKNIRYPLGNFSPEDAQAVIERLTERTSFQLESRLISQLVRDLAGELGEVRPIELQVVGAQLQTDKITTLARYQEFGTKEELVRRYLDEVVSDCGVENQQAAELVLYLLTDEKGTRPLKTRAELERDLQPYLAVGAVQSSQIPPTPFVKGGYIPPLTRGARGDRTLSETDVPVMSQLDLVLQIFVKSGLVLLLPENPDKRYQLVHDYLAAFIRQQQEPRLNELIAELKKEREQRQLTQEELKRAEQARQILAEANQKAIQRIRVGSAVLVAAVAALIWAGNEVGNALAQKKQADSRAKVANGEVSKAKVELTKTKGDAQQANQDLKAARDNLAAANQQVQQVKQAVANAEKAKQEAEAKTQQANQNLKGVQDNLIAANQQVQQAKQAVANAEKTKQEAETRTQQANQNLVLQVAKELRSQVTNQSRLSSTSYLAPAQQLYEWMIKPLEEALQKQGINNLVFLMDSPLRPLPLAALHDGKSFLVEKYSIGLMPGLTLTDNRHVDIKNASVLAMGVSNFTAQNPLPAVPGELSIIMNLWRGKSFLNEEFTLENLTLQRQKQPFQIIHIATHGQFKPGSPENSYIQLWDKKLRSDQLEQLGLYDLPVELLVLSAARSVLGDKRFKYGFAGSAVQAGAKSVLGSLWYESDEGTLGLMAEFYNQLRTAPIKAEALRQAQIAMLRGEVRLDGGQLHTPTMSIPLPPELAQLEDQNLSHPYYWSGFTMIGNPW